MIAVMGILFGLSQLPGSAVDLPLQHGFDKVAHALVYAVLAATVIYGRHAPGRYVLGSAIITLVVCVLYGLTDEFHQAFVPGRDPSGFDLLADGIGALLATAIWLAWRHGKEGGQ